MKLLTNKQQESYKNATLCYYCKETFKDKHARDKKFCKVNDPCHYTGEYRGTWYMKSNVECT